MDITRAESMMGKQFRQYENIDFDRPNEHGPQLYLSLLRHVFRPLSWHMLSMSAFAALARLPGGIGAPPGGDG